MRALLALLLLSACAHPQRGECHDTVTCRQMAAERERNFARVVADEPPVVRLMVDPVSQEVLIDRERGVVYVLDPVLVVLDLQTGKERWREASVSGDTLWRVGRFLAVTSEHKTLPPRVTFVDPAAPGLPVDCSVAVAAPSTAERASLHLFDRSGQPYLYWQSRWSYVGGVRPDQEALDRQKSARACGVVSVDPLTCAATAQTLADFVWPRQGEDCSTNSPMLDLPAAAASAPKYVPTALTVIIEKSRPSECTATSQRTLQFRNLAGAVVWSYPLETRHEEVCNRP